MDSSKDIMRNKRQQQQRKPRIHWGKKRNVAASLRILAKRWKAQRRNLFSLLVCVVHRREMQGLAFGTKRTRSRCTWCVCVYCPMRIPPLEVSCLLINRTLVQGLPTAFGKGARAKTLGPPGIWNSSQKTHTAHLHTDSVVAFFSEWSRFLCGKGQKNTSRPRSTPPQR